MVIPFVTNEAGIDWSKPLSDLPEIAGMEVTICAVVLQRTVLLLLAGFGQ